MKCKKATQTKLILTSSEFGRNNGNRKEEKNLMNKRLVNLERELKKKTKKRI